MLLTVASRLLAPTAWERGYMHRGMAIIIHNYTGGTINAFVSITDITYVYIASQLFC